MGISVPSAAPQSPLGKLMMVASPSRLQMRCCMGVRMTGAAVAPLGSSPSVPAPPPFWLSLPPSMAARTWATLRRTSVLRSDHFFFTSGSSRWQVATALTRRRMSCQAAALAASGTPALKWLMRRCLPRSSSSTMISTSRSEKFIFRFLAGGAGGDAMALRGSGGRGTQRAPEGPGGPAAAPRPCPDSRGAPRARSPRAGEERGGPEAPRGPEVSLPPRSPPWHRQRYANCVPQPPSKPRSTASTLRHWRNGFQNQPPFLPRLIGPPACLSGERLALRGEDCAVIGQSLCPSRGTTAGPASPLASGHWACVSPARGWARPPISLL